MLLTISFGSSSGDHHIVYESMKRCRRSSRWSWVRAKYKGQPQKLKQEIMALYKEQKVNPSAAACHADPNPGVHRAVRRVASAIELRFCHSSDSDLSAPGGCSER
jgi:hypothetical protein